MYRYLLQLFVIGNVNVDIIRMEIHVHHVVHEHIVLHDQIVVVVVLHDNSQIQINVVVKQKIHIRVKHESTCQRIVQHVIHVHVDMNVSDEVSL